MAYEQLALLLGGKVKTRITPYIFSPLCYTKVTSKRNGISVTVAIGELEGVVTVEGFQAKSNFSAALFRPAPTLGFSCHLVIDQKLDIYVADANLYSVYLSELVVDWAGGFSSLGRLQGLGSPVFFSDHQLEFNFPSTEVQVVGDVLYQMQDLLVIPPFSTRKSRDDIRYQDLPGVTIRQEEIPKSLREILDFAKEWSFLDLGSVDGYSRKVGKHRTKIFIDAFGEKATDIESFIKVEVAPVTDEIVLFQKAFEAFGNLR